MRFMKCAVFCVAMLACSVVFGQVDTNAPPEAPAPTAGAFATPGFIVDLLTPILALLVAAGIEKFKPTISVAWLGAITLAVGTVAAGLATVVLAGGTDVVSVLKSAALALGGVILKVVLDKLKPEPVPEAVQSSRAEVRRPASAEPPRA